MNVLKKNSILDDGENSDIFSRSTIVNDSVNESVAVETPRERSLSPVKVRGRGRPKGSLSKSKRKLRYTTKSPKKRRMEKQRKEKSHKEHTEKPHKRVPKDQEEEEEEEEEVEEQMEEQVQTEELDPKTVSLITVSEKIPKKLAQHTWQELNPKVLQSLQDLILNIYVEPTVIQSSKSDKVRGRLRYLLQELINEVIRKLQDVKLPILKSNDQLNLELSLNKKLYLESVLSSNLKQIEILEKELIKLEKIYNSDLTYFQNLQKAIESDDSVKGIDIDENLEYQIMNLSDKSAHNDLLIDDKFDQVLKKLDKHLTSIENNVKELTILNDKVTIVNDLLQLL